MTPYQRAVERMDAAARKASAEIARRPVVEIEIDEFTDDAIDAVVDLLANLIEQTVHE